MIIDYLDKKPDIAPSVKIFPGAIVAGEVTIKDNVSIWFNAVIRGDMAPVAIGRNTNIQDGVVVHTNTDLPTSIGDNVTVGHNAIIHAATVEDDALIGMGATILDGAVIGRQAMVAAGCLVPPGKIVPERTLVVGNPMRIVRELTDKEIANNHVNMEKYLQMMADYD